MSSQSTKIMLELPVKIDVEEARLMIISSLFGKGVLSSGKASEYLQMSRVDFLEKVGDFGISIFSEDEDSLNRAMNITL